MKELWRDPIKQKQLLYCYITFVLNGMLALSSMGSILMPSVIGRIADHYGIAPGMTSIVVVVIIDMILICALTAYDKKPHRQHNFSKKPPRFPKRKRGESALSDQ